MYNVLQNSVWKYTELAGAEVFVYMGGEGLTF